MGGRGREEGMEGGRGGGGEGGRERGREGGRREGGRGGREGWRGRILTDLDLSDTYIKRNVTVSKDYI